MFKTLLLRWITCALCLLPAGIAAAGAPAEQSGRIALVVGAGAYTNAPKLALAAGDATAIAQKLEQLHFAVDLVTDPDRKTFEEHLRAFGQRAKGGDVALFYFAGHAVEVDGRNWLLPVDAEPEDARALRFVAVDFDAVLEQPAGAARVGLFFLDACRDNPFRRHLTAATRGLGPSGLHAASAATGTLIAFATAPGAVASDGSGRHSPFTTALLKHMATPGLDIRQMMGLVRQEVRQSTRGAQIPWETSALEGAVSLNPAEPARSSGGHATESLFWDSVRASTSPADLEAYLARYPDGTFAVLARNRLAALAPPPPAGRPSAQQSSPAAPFADQLAKLLARQKQYAPRLDSYLKAAGHKAMAIHPASGRGFFWERQETAQLAEEMALEACQIRYNSPCTLVASDETLRTAELKDGTLRPMPRVGYAGPYDPRQVPLQFASQAGARADYLKAAGPKAMALSAPRGINWATGASSSEAQAKALAQCNRPDEPYPCLLYAIDSRVVLPRHLTGIEP